MSLSDNGHQNTFPGLLFWRRKVRTPVEVGQSSDHQKSVATYKNTGQEMVKNQHFQNSGN